MDQGICLKARTWDSCYFYIECVIRFTMIFVMGALSHRYKESG